MEVESQLRSRGAAAALALALAAAAVSQPPENAHSQEPGAWGRGHRGGIHPSGSRVGSGQGPPSQAVDLTILG
jgi:hypothetical protein